MVRGVRPTLLSPGGPDGMLHLHTYRGTKISARRAGALDSEERSLDLPGVLRARGRRDDLVSQKGRAPAGAMHERCSCGSEVCHGRRDPRVPGRDERHPAQPTILRLPRQRAFASMVADLHYRGHSHSRCHPLPLGTSGFLRTTGCQLCPVFFSRRDVRAPKVAPRPHLCPLGLLVSRTLFSLRYVLRSPFSR
ncbi:hypothetical protein C8F04DRAFT_307437 [Mycena alexandri]|uniref:Uncharacterized protein n=1 Tax=Mycena alexandri TaxID=1745969 RepID=A0AAD6T4U3_9AGAR|nr:hypothetical protein C8F04DRAFT_307437 [Mycena alexandri]